LFQTAIYNYLLDRLSRQESDGAQCLGKALGKNCIPAMKGFKNFLSSAQMQIWETRAANWAQILTLLLMLYWHYSK
jgi:hypothetical protein